MTSELFVIFNLDRLVRVSVEEPHLETVNVCEIFNVCEILNIAITTTK